MLSTGGVEKSQPSRFGFSATAERARHGIRFTESYAVGQLIGWTATRGADGAEILVHGPPFSISNANDCLWRKAVIHRWFYNAKAEGLPSDVNWAFGPSNFGALRQLLRCRVPCIATACNSFAEFN